MEKFKNNQNIASFLVCCIFCAGLIAVWTVPEMDILKSRPKVALSFVFIGGFVVYFFSGGKEFLFKKKEKAPVKMEPKDSRELIRLYANGESALVHEYLRHIILDLKNDPDEIKFSLLINKIDKLIDSLEREDIELEKMKDEIIECWDLVKKEQLQE